MIMAVQPQSNIVRIDAKLPNVRIDSALDDVDLIMGCFDNDYPRLLTTARASERKTVYIDAASGIDVESLFYGGRVLVAGESAGCLYCLGELDQNEIRRAQLTAEQLQVEADIYGVPIEQLSGTGPSVVTLNGVVASIATTEAMAVLTGLRRGHKLHKYLANFGVVRQSGDLPSPDCFYCTQWARLLTVVAIRLEDPPGGFAFRRCDADSEVLTRGCPLLGRSKQSEMVPRYRHRGTPNSVRGRNDKAVRIGHLLQCRASPGDVVFAVE
jgi:hypothetical protein